MARYTTGGRLIHLPTGRTYSYYSSVVFKDDRGEPFIGLTVRRGGRKSEYVKLPLKDTEKIKCRIS